LRTSSALALALAPALAACGPEAGPPQGEAIECAIGPGADFARDCTVEIAAGEALVIHHPGGGFRRFVREGGGLLPLDGADPLVMVAQDPAGGIEFAIAGDRYRLPPPGEAE